MAVPFAWPATFQECNKAIESLTQEISVRVQEVEALMCNMGRTPEEIDWISSNQYEIRVMQAELKVWHAIKERLGVIYEAL